MDRTAQYINVGDKWTGQLSISQYIKAVMFVIKIYKEGIKGNPTYRIYKPDKCTMNMIPKT
jgi:hypothetical protein